MVNGKEIEFFQISKYTGSIIDQKQKFEAQLKGVTKARIPNVSTMRLFSTVFDSKWLIRVYTTYI